MTLDQLRYFTAAATYEHIGRAANTVSISASVISSAISSLEIELDCQLFKKNGRNIQLTKDGEKLLKRSKALLEEVNHLKADLKKTSVSLSGHFRLGASHFLASRHLLSFWEKVQRKHPQLTGDLQSLSSSAVLGEVLSGRLDAGICFSPLKHPHLFEKPLHRGELNIVVRKKHPILKKNQKEQIQFLKDSHCILHKSSQGIDICDSHPVFEKLGIEPKSDQTFDNDEIAVQSVLNSDRWSFLPDIVCEYYKNVLEIIELPKSAGIGTYTISLISHAARENDPVIKELSAQT